MWKSSRVIVLHNKNRRWKEWRKTKREMIAVAVSIFTGVWNFKRHLSEIYTTSSLFVLQQHMVLCLVTCAVTIWAYGWKAELSDFFHFPIYKRTRHEQVYNIIRVVQCFLKFRENWSSSTVSSGNCALWSEHKHVKSCCEVQKPFSRLKSKTKKLVFFSPFAF